MNLPDKINILGFEYKIVLIDKVCEDLILDDKLCSGIIDHDLQTIYLNVKEKNEERVLQTLVHEIIHAIEYLFDRHQEITALKEWQIDMIATGITSIILNNKGIVK